MALAFSSGSSVGGGGTGPFTVAHTCSGSERVLFAGIVYYHVSASLTSVTYNSTELTAVSGGSYDPGGDFHIRWFYMINPPTGTNTFSYTFSAGVHDSGVTVTSWEGADQSVPYGTPVGNTNTTTTPTVDVSSATDEHVIDALMIIHTGTLTVGAGQTQIANAIAPNGTIKYGGSRESGASTTTMSWSNSSSQFWATMALSVKPSSGAPAGQPTGKRLGGIPYMSSSFSPRVW